MEFKWQNSASPYGTSFVWLDMLKHVFVHGQSAAPRGQKTAEILGCMSRINMQYPVMAVAERGLGYKFMAAEAAWILSGDNRVATIEPYSKAISQFSDDGVFFFGAYGPKIRDQIPYVLGKFLKDESTRHAFINIWREQPRDTKDVPCTASLQFMIRRSNGVPYLYCFDTMRSSDVWLGWPYDIFNMSMISLYLCLLLRDADKEKYGHIELGTLTLTAASQHLYENNYDKAREITSALSHQLPDEGEIRAWDTSLFSDAQHLIDYLWAVAKMENRHAKNRLLSLE